MDGSHYKNFDKSGGITLMLYSDGVQLANNNRHFWPVFATIVELPLIIRDSIKSKMIAGTWYGKKKPTSDILFSNLVTEINYLRNNGISFVINNKKYQTSVNVRKNYFALIILFLNNSK